MTKRFAALSLLLPSALLAQQTTPAPSLISPLSALANPHPGRAMHEGSWDRNGGNGDLRNVKPGETLTLLDYQGAGVIRRFWVTIAPRADQKIHRQAILRMYWDGAKDPCVEAPIGDFFGVGFGLQKDFISLPLNQTSGGYNCYWPMPFHKSARWTLTNLSDKTIDAFYYNIDFTALDSLPADTKHFHASYRRENPTTPNKNYTILEAEGDGHFVGTLLSMQGLKPRDIGFLEGDETIYIDQENALKIPSPEHSDQKPKQGDPTPNIIGTGTEDYFSSGWYYDRGTYSAPYHGVTVKDELTARISTYRWHIEDAMPFHKNIRVSIEHGTNNDHSADYSSVAYFYQSEPHKPYPALPTKGEDFMPTPPPEVKHFKDVIEAETLKDSATLTGKGFVNVQPMTPFPGEWSGDAQLWWTAGSPGDTLTLNLPAPADGTYELLAYITTAPDYGTFTATCANQTSKEVDLYSEGVHSHPPTSLGTVHLKKGDNPLTLKITGKNRKSTGHLIGLDAFQLKKTQ